MPHATISRRVRAAGAAGHRAAGRRGVRARHRPRAGGARGTPRLARRALHDVRSAGRQGPLRWRTIPGTEARDGLPRRLYTATAAGLAALRAAREIVRRLWDGLDARLKDPSLEVRTRVRTSIPPRLAEWLLRHLLPLDGQNDAIRGDLLEEFRRRRPRLDRVLAPRSSLGDEHAVLARIALAHPPRTWIQENADTRQPPAGSALRVALVCEGAGVHAARDD